MVEEDEEKLLDPHRQVHHVVLKYILGALKQVWLVACLLELSDLEGLLPVGVNVGALVALTAVVWGGEDGRYGRLLLLTEHVVSVEAMSDALVCPNYAVKTVALH